MKISGQEHGELWVKGESLTVFILQLIKLKAGPKCELTDSCRSLERQCRRGCQSHRRAEDESLIIARLPQWFVIPSIGWALLSIRGAQNEQPLPVTPCSSHRDRVVG